MPRRFVQPAALILAFVVASQLGSSRAQSGAGGKYSSSSQMFPILTVTESNLGQWVFEGATLPVQTAAAPGTPLNFSWLGDASGYGGTVDAYRFGWDIRDPNNDEEWQTSWSPSLLSAPTRTFNSGTHRFSVQVRDSAGAITTGVVEITVEILGVDAVSWGQFKLQYHESRQDS